eukprot:gene10680-biopygen4947
MTFGPKMGFADVRRVHSFVFFRVLQLGLVYVAEYACQNAAAYVQPCTYTESVNKGLRYVIWARRPPEHGQTSALPHW